MLSETIDKVIKQHSKDAKKFPEVGQALRMLEGAKKRLEIAEQAHKEYEEKKLQRIQETKNKNHASKQRKVSK